MGGTKKNHVFVPTLLLTLTLGMLGYGEIGHAQTTGISPSVAELSGAGPIADIRIEGVERIDPATVRSYLRVLEGDAFDPVAIDESLKALFATGLFADVVFRRDGDDLVLTIVENPIINRIAFEGNQRIDDEQLSAEVQLRPRVVYTRTRVQADVQRILEVYRRSGRFAATVDPKVIELDQNRVDLVFEIDEGPRTGILRINFIGNSAFSDGTLRGQIQTKESRWYRFLTADDTYDPDRIAFDRELLRRFYLSEGYADFRVVSAVAELAPDREGFIVTFTVEEGDRYQFGVVDVASGLRGLEADSIRDAVVSEAGDWYDANEVEESVTALTAAAEAQQFPFVEVRPRIQRDREELLINVTYEVLEGPRIFIDRIDITGNTRTLDKVIRRELTVAEGDPFNRSRLSQSERSVRDLGYFERVTITSEPGIDPDRADIEVNVAEQATGELSFGAGFSTNDGALGDFSLRERNFLGRGQDVRIGATLSGRRQEYDFSFTEPYFLDRDLSAGFDVFRITRDNQDESSFDEQSLGFGIRFGYPLTERLRQRVSYGWSIREITDVGSDASRLIRDQEGERTVSEVSQELFYDARDSRLRPTSGYYARLSTGVAGLGGDVQYFRAEAESGFFVSLLTDMVLSVSAEVGQIVGLGQDVNISDRFFLGGDSLRGFEVGGVGPRDLDTDDSLGGNQFARGSVELSFPLGLPDEFALAGHVFTDAGSLAQLDGSAVNVVDEHALRLASGAGVSWRSPFGPIRLDFVVPFAKEDFDKDERVRFSFGTRF